MTGQKTPLDSPASNTDDVHWVGTWSAAQQLTEVGNLPPPPGLSQSTLRQVVHVSIGGKRVRLRFSNAFGNARLTLASVHCAVSAGADAMVASTDRTLLFSGAASVTIPAKQAVVSDPFDFDLTATSNLAVSIQFGDTPTDVTGHPGSRTTSYLQYGNHVSAARMPASATTDHWYVLSRVEVLASTTARAIVVLGDSITDGRGSTTNGNDRWPDVLARRLQQNPTSKHVSVLNLGIGGNAVLTGGLGPPALERFSNDVLDQPGARWLIVLEGVNDIGNSSNPSVATDLIDAFKQCVARAHAQGMLAYGVPILPFGGNADYDSAAHEAARLAVNGWIRTPGNFDKVIDLDAVVRDPNRPAALLAAYDSGDHLHLNAAGYQKMGKSVDWELFRR